jgi:hypothetical protein
MKRHFPSDDQTRFSTKVRHYHRSGGKTQRSWDEWVEGVPSKPRSPKKRLKIVIAAVGLIILGSIMVGLVVELM